MAKQVARRRRLVGSGIGVSGYALAVVALALSVGVSPRVSASPHTPLQDSVVIERLPASVGPRSGTAGDIDADRMDAALALARTYIDIGRAHADPRFYGRARGALRPWWDMADPPPGVRLLRAVLRQSNHDFEAALSDLDAVLEADPRNAQAWLSRAMILRVRGAHAAAGESCARLNGLVEPLLSGACLASVGRLGNTLRESYQLLERIVAQSESSPAVHRQWALTVLAELAARLGEQGAAEEHLRAALATGGRSVAALADYADLLLDSGDARVVRDLLREEFAADGLLLRLALAERALGEPGWRGHAETLRARFAANRARGAGETHLREEARAALLLFDEPARALQLALRNWQLQRESWDARLVLSAALASGRHRAADAVLRWLDQERFLDKRLAALGARVVGL